MEQAPASNAVKEAVMGIGARNGWRSARPKPTLVFFVLFCVVWLILYGLYTSLPLLKPGADVVAATKFSRIVTGTMFPPQARNRVLIFGTSRVLAGFIPVEFDRLFDTDTVSYNLGLPGEARFLPILEATLAAGNVPTLVLLTVSWDKASAAPTLFKTIQDDSNTISYIAPFRHFPRDAALFVLQSHLHLLRKYHEAEIECDKVVRNRGWYFIKSESYYPGDRLPDDFHLPSDQPDIYPVRSIPTHSMVRQRLMDLALRYHFKIVFVPTPERQGAVKIPADIDSTTVTKLSTLPDIRSVGPVSLIYPPRDFLDPVHLNTEGAKLYTADLARLLSQAGVQH